PSTRTTRARETLSLHSPDLAMPAATRHIDQSPTSTLRKIATGTRGRSSATGPLPAGILPAEGRIRPRDAKWDEGSRLRLPSSRVPFERRTRRASALDLIVGVDHVVFLRRLLAAAGLGARAVAVAAARGAAAVGRAGGRALVHLLGGLVLDLRERLEDLLDAVRIVGVAGRLELLQLLLDLG